MRCAECGLPINPQTQRIHTDFGFVHAECHVYMPKNPRDWEKYRW